MLYFKKENHTQKKYFAVGMNQSCQLNCSRSHTDLIGVLRPVNVDGVVSCHYGFNWMKLYQSLKEVSFDEISSDHYLLTNFHFLLRFLDQTKALFLQVNLFQKPSFLHQLTHNMTRYCSQNSLKSTSSEHVVYKKFYFVFVLTFSTIFVHNMF